MTRRHLLALTVARVLIAAGAAQSQDLPPVHQAIKDKNLDALQEHLDAGAEVNENVGGLTPLGLATRLGVTLASKLLLERGADATLTDAGGYTPMHVAAFHGYHRIVRLLLDHGEPHTTFHDDGLAPLHRAVVGKELKHMHTVKMLLEAGADPKLRATPVSKAQQEKNKNKKEQGWSWWDQLKNLDFDDTGKPFQKENPSENDGPQSMSLLPAAMSNREDISALIQEYLLKAFYAANPDAPRSHAERLEREKKAKKKKKKKKKKKDEL